MPDSPGATTGSRRDIAVRALADVPRVPGAAKPDPILIANDVTRRFGGLTAVDVEHVEIQRGAITALIGPNGAGKTTFFNLLTGFDTPDTGSWLFNGQDLAGIAAYKVARMGMIRTFQLTKALSKMTVLENMRLGATAQRGEIVVALIGDEATVKYFFPEKDYIRFQPANAAMAPILVRASDFRPTMLLGVVIGVYRKM